MRPERLTVTLRPRGALEAIDLGFALVQAHARDVRRAWLLVVLPMMLLLALLEHALPAGWRYPGLLMWWGKPLYDVVILLVLSRAVFGERASPRLLYTEVRRLAGTVIASLTLRRLSLARSFLLPVHVLEGVHGTSRRARVALLETDTIGSARLATIAGAWIEAAMLAGLVSLVFWFTPDIHLPPLYDVFTDEGSHLAVAAWQLVYVVAVSLVEPFYVGAGFALYLNRRTVLEGWDIEVALRRIAARLPEPRGEDA